MGRRVLLKFLKRIVWIIVIILLAFGLKFAYELVHSPYNEAMNHPDRLTIFYRRGCSRCHKALPRLIIPAYFSIKREYFINANKLSDKQLNKVGLTITPGFYTHGKLYETINANKIKSLWKER